MTYEVARMVTIPALMAGSALLVRRYRGYGVLVSILLGWGILVAVYNTWPAPAGEYDEDREEMPSMGPIVMALWCLPVWGVVELWLWLRKRGSKSHEIA
jgi:hypothetical protein